MHSLIFREGAFYVRQAGKARHRHSNGLHQQPCAVSQRDRGVYMGGGFDVHHVAKVRVCGDVFPGRGSSNHIKRHHTAGISAGPLAG